MPIVPRVKVYTSLSHSYDQYTNTNFAGKFDDAQLPVRNPSHIIKSHYVQESQFSYSFLTFTSTRLAAPCVMTNTDATEAIEPKNASIELHPVFTRGYMTIEMNEKATPNVKNIHIVL